MMNFVNCRQELFRKLSSIYRVFIIHDEFRKLSSGLKVEHSTIVCFLLYSTSIQYSTYLHRYLVNSKTSVICAMCFIDAQCNI